MDKPKITTSIRIFDNNGETLDRYTVVLIDSLDSRTNLYTCLGLCSTGKNVSMFGECSPDWLGQDKEILLDSLPAPLKRHIESRIG